MIQNNLYEITSSRNRKINIGTTYFSPISYSLGVNKLPFLT